jgi:HD-GYP domain-containing protein (c-di-GMP phosphodiesterase class II)/PAS domain-containing protein
VHELVELLESLSGRDASRRIAIILQWMLSKLRIEGVALVVRIPSEGTVVRDSLGSLTAMAPLLAAEWSLAGLPQERGVFALPGGNEGADAYYCVPLGSPSAEQSGILVLQGRGIGRILQTREEDLGVAVGELEKALAPDPSGAQALEDATQALSRLPQGLSLLTEGLRLPLYSCDLQGRFLYASPAFLDLTGHPSLESLAIREDFFSDPRSRMDELATIRSVGKVVSYPLVTRSGSGNKLEIRDSAVCFGESIYGLFFDVTALMAANAELKDALQVQELLNDNIMAGTKTLQRTQGASIRTLARLAEYRDPETGYHLQRICEYTRLLAMEVQEREPYPFRITREYGNDISLSSMLHDIGKVSIPDHILLKPGKLDPPEWDTMKKHTYFGWEVLHKADKELGEQSFLTLAATIALSHHERYDGKGYPNGSVGEQIPLSARISAVADVYDALTSTRPYKPAWTHEQASEEILRQSGCQFDPVLVEIFRDVNDRFADVRSQFPG